MDNEFNNNENMMENENSMAVLSGEQLTEGMEKEFKEKEEKKALKKAEERKLVREAAQGGDRFTRVFETKGGEKAAVLYAEPVHYLKDSGWAQIDNRLIYNEKDEVYENRESRLKVRFAGKADAEELIRTEKNGHCLSWTLLSEEKTDVGFEIDDLLRSSESNAKEPPSESHGAIRQTVR